MGDMQSEDSKEETFQIVFEQDTSPQKLAGNEMFGNEMSGS